MRRVTHASVSEPKFPFSYTVGTEVQRLRDHKASRGVPARTVKPPAHRDVEHRQSRGTEAQGRRPAITRGNHLVVRPCRDTGAAGQFRGFGWHQAESWGVLQAVVLRCGGQRRANGLPV